MLFKEYNEPQFLLYRYVICDLIFGPAYWYKSRYPGYGSCLYIWLCDLLLLHLKVLYSTIDQGHDEYMFLSKNDTRWNIVLVNLPCL